VADGYPLIPEELPQQFRAAMRRLAASVAIVAARGEAGPIGMAATSVTSLTADPPAMLVCVNRATALHGLLVLSRDQQDVSAAFGGGVSQDERFRIGEWRDGPDGLPELAGAQANLGCVIDAMLAYGTHSIVIARVLRATVSDGIAPLIYQDGTYL
jgi:flavin reductase (DIM6/NTAB) family NADH-FMN oxidoreductase RutF